MPKFTVYLIKEEYNNIERYTISNGTIVDNRHSIFDRSVMIEYNAQLYSHLSDRNIKPKVIHRTNQENNYYRSHDPQPPWWKDFWSITDSITSQSADLLVVREIGGRIFVITHGQSRYCINPFAIEYDFGLRTALNVLDSNKIKCTDLFTPSEFAVKTKLQTGKDAEIKDLEIDIFKNLLKNIAGKVKEEYEDYFASIEGADSIKFNYSGTVHGLDSLIENLYTTYNLESYRESGFEWIDYFRPIKDKELLSNLFNTLSDSINNRNEDIVLTYPVHFDETKNIYFQYTGFRDDSLFPSIEISQYYTLLDRKQITVITVENIKNHSINAKNFDDQATVDSQRLFYCLYFETTYEGSHYFFESGNWYKVEDSFTREIESFFNSLKSDSLELNTQYNHTEIEAEARRRNCNKELIYNEKLVEDLSQEGSTHLFDTDLINYMQSRTEFCDVFHKSSENNFLIIHNKYKYGSAALSHLFSQGIVSAEFLCDKQYREIVNTKHGIDELKFTDSFNREDFTVVYGIITKRDRSGDFSIPLFSKINIRGFITNLNRMNFKTKIAFIEHV